MITYQLMESLFPTKGLNPKKFNLVRDRAKLIDAMNRILPKYGINTYLRLCAFLGNCGIETDYFRTTIEYASGEAYEGRAGLGNTQPGDGKRFKGRGLTQTTGRANYKAVQKAIGRQLGIDVVLNPDWLAEIEIAVESACIFWRDNNLNSYADRGLFKQLSAIVNRGDKNKTPLHWSKRNELYSLCKRRVPVNFRFLKVVESQPSMIAPTTTGGVAQSSPSPVTNATPEPIVLTPTEPAKDDSFLSAALDKNLSADEAKEMAKTALPSFGARLWKFIARPVLWIYTALEAGNVAAWLGVVVVIGILIYVIYLNRASIKKALQTVKNKFIA